MEQERIKRFKDFIHWFETYCKGKEKAEGQIFFERLLQAFGNGGVHQAGAVCEDPLRKKSGRIGFADLVWKPRVIIELKQRGVDLRKHYHQAAEYWFVMVPNRPQYMCLCNFDEFWIYDLNVQLHDPVHIFKTRNLTNDWGALGFLFPSPERPIFNNNNVEVTEKAASIVGSLFRSLIERKVDAHQAQRFVLQLVVALFSQDVGLIPKYTLRKILQEAMSRPITQKELGDLFSAMAVSDASKKPQDYREIPYFNGGLFQKVEPVELTFRELDLLAEAAKPDWSKVRPSIFGSIFEASMDPVGRHGHGIHYTSEPDIQKIVNPTIVRPFKKRIEDAKGNKKKLKQILEDIQNFTVLDPACGSGNFLYIAFRELSRLEIEVLDELDKDIAPGQQRFDFIGPKNFFGIDTNEFGIELAKVSLCIGRKLVADEFALRGAVLPFDNLDDNFLTDDALFAKWPKTDAVIGNPPFLSSKFMKVEYPVEYVNRVRAAFPEVPGRADYCVYWFRKAHDSLMPGQRAGLVGTNTIRQNYSREGGLDYIVANGGTITEAVSTQVWSGDANVHVSIVNWVKGADSFPKKLFTQLGDRNESPWRVEELVQIGSSLTSGTDVSSAKDIRANSNPKRCFVGQAPQSDGFYLSPEQAKQLLRANKSNADVIFPFLIGREMLNSNASPNRYVIDFGQRDINKAKKYAEAFHRIEQLVLPDVTSKAENELKKSGKQGDWHAHLQKWWLHWRPRPELFHAIKSLKRFIAVSRVTKRPIFEFVSTHIHPGDALVAFAFEDDYSFGVLQSLFHREWFKARCSTLKGDSRYTGDTVFDTFPWPQNPTFSEVKNVAQAAFELRQYRRRLITENQWGLKQVYETLELPGKNPLKELHYKLDLAVGQAFGISTGENVLAFLLELNRRVAEMEQAGDVVTGPGLPVSIKNVEDFISDDCILPN